MSTQTEKLAIHGGTPVKTTPYGTGKRWGEAELRHLKEAIEQDSLFYTKGRKCAQFREAFASRYGMKHCVLTNSGTAAIHVALGALDVGVGDEVITAPISDMGSVIGMLYQNAVPIFADLHPHTYNMTAETIEPKITEHTKAILVVHLAGAPCDMDPILELASARGIPVFEDCAQSYLCEYKGRLVGTIGAIGCFSLNDFKHIGAGDAGMILTNDDRLADKAALFADKMYDRTGQSREITQLAPNYRTNELVAAVALGQLEKLDGIVAGRRRYGDALHAGVDGLAGLHPHGLAPGGRHSYWFYLMRIDPDVLKVDRDEFAAACIGEGLNNWDTGYTASCLYNRPLFQNRTAYPNSHYPFVNPELGRDYRYHAGDCPNAEAIIETGLYFPVREFFTEQDAAETVAGVRKVHAYFHRKAQG
jgi:dTDP-4-amino-4,6-dideoxygalactose transaminase